jgi:hypothetical protein
LRVLFLLRFREGSGGVTDYSVGHYFSSGLYHSARLVVEMLNASGVDAKLVQVVDSNDIDLEVFAYRPTHVVLEALWVPPAKFGELLPLHPGVVWIVRNHSELPFLAQEGIAIEWLTEYALFGNVYVASNSLDASQDLAPFLNGKSLYLPNYYHVAPVRVKPRARGELNVGCFGAIRPLKNQLIQAVAAIDFAKQERLPLFFHVNAGRVELDGDNVLRNLRALFASAGQMLVEHPWEDYQKFLDILRKDIDVGMQVSLSETFNIVAADMVANGIPIVVSEEIPWAAKQSQAEPTSRTDILAKLRGVTGWWRQSVARANQDHLNEFSEDAREQWLRVLKQLGGNSWQS